MDTDLEIWMDGFVKNNIIVPYNPKLHEQVLQHYDNKQVEYCIRIKKRKPSKEMHAFVRKVLYPISQSAEVFGGWTLNRIISFYKKEHFGNDKQSLADVNYEQMHSYIDYIVNMLATHGITVPDKPLTPPSI